MIESVVVVSSRFEKFQVKSGVSPRPDFFKVTTSRFEFLKSRSEKSDTRQRIKTKIINKPETLFTSVRILYEFDM